MAGGANINMDVDSIEINRPILFKHDPEDKHRHTRERGEGRGGARGKHTNTQEVGQGDFKDLNGHPGETGEEIFEYLRGWGEGKHNLL